MSTSMLLWLYMGSLVRKNMLRVVSAAGVVAICALAIATLLGASNRTAIDALALRSWGDNDAGQLGTGHLNFSSGSLVARPNTVALKHVEVVAVYAGLRHSLALTKDGSVYAWGSNSYGQLGLGKLGGSHVSPRLVKGLPKITMLATKQDHTLALDTDGQVWAWGLNMSGQLGDRTNTNRATPYKIPGLNDVTYIAAGYRSSAVVKRDGSVWQWGGNCNLAQRDKTLASYVAGLKLTGYNDGAGGTIEHITPEDDCHNEDFIRIKSYVPVRVTGIPSVTSLSIGYGHTLAIAADHTLWSWGCNMYGQIGNGRDDRIHAYASPAKVQGIGHVVAASAGFRHSLALDDDGQVWAWGHRYFGEVGDGTINLESNVKQPRIVTGLHDITALAAGHDYSLVVTKGGDVYGWGQASFNQLGKQDEVAIGRPLRLQSSLAAVKNVVAGGAHVLVMLGRK